MSGPRRRLPALSSRRGKSSRRRYRNATGVFNPLSITGLVAWYDLSDATTLYTDAGTTLVTADADPIYQVNDKSGSGNHITQATEGLRPAYKVNIQNGLSAALNDGDAVWDNARNFTATQPTTIIIATTPGAASACGIVDGYGTRQLVGINATPNWQLFAGTGPIVGGTPVGGTDYILAAQFNGASSFLYANGGTAAVSGDAGSAALGDSTNPSIAVFSDNATAEMPNNSYLYEVLIYDAGLTLAQINQVANYLSTKWGVTWTTAT
jgi:hypothetical protein